MSSYNIEISDAKDFAPVIADEVVLSICEAVEERGVCNLVLAGGATPSGIYRLFSRPPRVADIPWDKVRIFWGDERWVSKEDSQSNYRMAQETFLSQVPIKESALFPIDTTLPSAEAAAQAYHQTLKAELAASGGVFDLVLLGLGEDGHTASLFPGTSWDTPQQDLALAVKHPENGGWRVSISMSALKAARKVIFIVKGEGKAEALAQVIEKNAVALPAQQFLDLGERLTWFVDSAAAVKLKKH